MLWRWSTTLVRKGHRFEGAVWRCADCHRSVYDLLDNGLACLSPDPAGRCLFLGGPFHEEWRVETERTLIVPIPDVPDTYHLDAEGQLECAVYERRRTKHGLIVYEFTGKR